MKERRHRHGTAARLVLQTGASPTIRDGDGPSATARPRTALEERPRPVHLVLAFAEAAVKPPEDPPQLPASSGACPSAHADGDVRLLRPGLSPRDQVLAGVGAAVGPTHPRNAVDQGGIEALPAGLAVRLRTPGRARASGGIKSDQATVRLAITTHRTAGTTVAAHAGDWRSTCGAACARMPRVTPSVASARPPRARTCPGTAPRRRSARPTARRAARDRRARR